jgi:hypothetical protein
MAITGGMLAVAAVVLGIAAAFANGDHDPHAAAATQNSIVSAVAAGGGAPPKIAAPPTAAPSIDVPVISVDSLPVATRNSTPKAAGSGRLAIVASPGQCAVSVDGVAKGSTPIGGLELAAGPHRIDCAPPSGKPKTVSVTISEGASARYKFSFDD